MSDTVDRVKKATSQILKIDMDKIDNNALFVEDLGADSMQSIELVAALEEEFEIEMNEDEALTIKNINDAASYIEKVIAGG